MKKVNQKSIKRIFSMSMVFVMVVLMALNVMAQGVNEDIAFKHASALNKLGLFMGTPKGFELDKSFTREQSVVMALKLTGKFSEAEKSSPAEVFSDVPTDHWAAKYIGYAKNAGITGGIGDGVFGTGKVVSVRDYLTLLLRTLGYDDKAGDFKWYSPFSKASEVGLISSDDEVYFETKYPNFPMTRDMVVNYTYQCLLAGINNKDFTLAKKMLDEGVLTEDQISSTFDNNIFAALKGIPAKNVTIRHYTINSDDKTYVKRLFPNFSKENPNIKMDLITVPYEEYDTKLQVLCASGCAPDVTSHWGQIGFTEYYNKGMLQDLSQVISNSGFKPADYHLPENIYNFFNINGKQYGVPVYIYATAISYNKDMFDAAKIPYPPVSYEDKSWTFDKMVDVAKKLTKNRDNLSKAQFGLDFQWGEWDMRPMYFGEKVYSDDTWKNGGNPSQVFFNSPGVVKAYQKLSDLFHKDRCSPTAQQAITLAGGNQGDPFAAGKVAMTCTGLWEIYGNDSYSFRTGVAAVPWYNTTSKARSVIFADPLFVMKDCKYPKEAFKWIEYQMRTDVQKNAVELSYGNPPSNLEAFETYYNFFKPISAKDLKTVVEGSIKYGIESTNHTISNYGPILDEVKNEMVNMEEKNVPASKVCASIQSKVTGIINKKK